MSNVIDLELYRKSKKELPYKLDCLDTITYTLTINDIECEMSIGEDLVTIYRETSEENEDNKD